VVALGNAISVWPEPVNVAPAPSVKLNCSVIENSAPVANGIVALCEKDCEARSVWNEAERIDERARECR
jgi:hypothetical protein